MTVHIIRSGFDWRNDTNQICVLQPLPGVVVSTAWIDDQWIRVTVYVDGDLVIDVEVWATVLTGANIVRSVLWRSRFAILDHLPRVGANPRTLNQDLLDCDAYQGPAAVRNGLLTAMDPFAGLGLNVTASVWSLRDPSRAEVLVQINGLTLVSDRIEASAGGLADLLDRNRHLLATLYRAQGGPGAEKLQTGLLPFERRPASAAILTVV